MTESVRIITSRWDNPAAVSLDGYLADRGYEAMRMAFAMAPTELIDLVKTSGLRGRGGAGFPTGVKWSFVPQTTGKPTYVVANFDESEPGTCNNRELIEHDPHQFLEGLAIASYAVQCHSAFVYIRGEYLTQARILQRAITEAYDRGIFGPDAHGTGYALDVVLHRGAGAYICGEETALLNSLEGERGQPRLRPPFPAVEGLYASPTVVNNVETLSNVPHVVLNGPEWFAAIGTEKSSGTKMFTVSGKVNRPGNFEVPMGTSARVLIEDLAGGMLDGGALKAWTPGGSSTPLLTAAHIDTKMDFESVAEAGSLLGTGALMILDETDCVVDAVLRMAKFYAHESCGKCTTCREGSWWVSRVLDRVEHGEGRMQDIELLNNVVSNQLFKGFCALVDGAVSPVQSSLKYFRDEYEAHIELGACPLQVDHEPVGAGVSSGHGLDTGHGGAPHHA